MCVRFGLVLTTDLSPNLILFSFLFKLLFAISSSHSFSYDHFSFTYIFSSSSFHDHISPTFFSLFFFSNIILFF